MELWGSFLNCIQITIDDVETVERHQSLKKQGNFELMCIISKRLKQNKIRILISFLKLIKNKEKGHYIRHFQDQIK